MSCQNVLIVAFCLFVSTLASAQDLVEEAFEMTPGRTDLAAHGRVPLVYSAWEREVAERYGPYALARYQDALKEDLPPHRGAGKDSPTNPVLSYWLKTEPAKGKALILALLRAKPERPQWSAAQLCHGIEDPALNPLLAEIATVDPQPVDRAQALLALSARKAPELEHVVKSAIFDESFSVRLLALELAQEPPDIPLLYAVFPRNPFHFLFLEKALAKRLPGVKVGKFFALSPQRRLELLESRHPGARESVLETLRAQPEGPVSDCLLYLLGDEEERSRSWARLETLLLDHGTKPEVYHSPEFWVQAEIISTLSKTGEGGKQPLVESLHRNLADFSQDKEVLILALAYAFQKLKVPEVEADLARIRTLKAKRGDLYQSAATGLAGMRSREAFPSLIHALSLNKHPFTVVSVQLLEKLTGIKTPGKPEDLGVLHNLGLPKQELDGQGAYEFWRDWYSKNKDKLLYDATLDLFVVK